MACVYRRRKQYWISYYVNGEQVKESLHTSNERVALAKKKRIEYELSLGDLQVASQLPLVPVLEAFCKHLESTRTFKSFKNDFSRLRTFSGPICQSLESCPPGVKRGQQTKKAAKDKYAGAHVQVGFLEDISPEVIRLYAAAVLSKGLLAQPQAGAAWVHGLYEDLFGPAVHGEPDQPLDVVLGVGDPRQQGTEHPTGSQVPSGRFDHRQHPISDGRGVGLKELHGCGSGQGSGDAQANQYAVAVLFEEIEILSNRGVLG